MGVKDYNIRDFLEGKLTLSQIWEDSYSEPSDEGGFHFSWGQDSERREET